MSLLSPLSRLLPGRDARARVRQAHQIYLRLARQSRQPFFYAELGVPDTPDGRFDCIALHLALVLQRLRHGQRGGPFQISRPLGSQDEEGRAYNEVREPDETTADAADGKNEMALGQALLEVFFSDMDRSLREMGVGDMGVGRRVKHMADVFYGRLQAYESAKDAAAFGEALRRNVYAEAAPTPAQIDGLARYALVCRDSLRAAPLSALEGDTTAWPLAA